MVFKKKKQKTEQEEKVVEEQTDFKTAWMRLVREFDKLTKYLQGVDENDLYDVQEILGHIIEKADYNIKHKRTDSVGGVK